MMIPLDEPHDRGQYPVMRLFSFWSVLLASVPRVVVGACARRTSLAAVALVAGLGLAAPSPAESAAGSADIARVHAPVLDRLFGLLATAPDAETAAEARTRIRALWAQSGSDTADLLSSRASRAVVEGDTRLAVDLLDAALVLAPDWASGRHRRAVVHLMRREFGPAVGDLEASLRLEPRQFEAMFTLAGLLEGLGRKTEALEQLRAAAALDPRAPGLGAWLDRLTIEVEGREL